MDLVAEEEVTATPTLTLNSNQIFCPIQMYLSPISNEVKTKWQIHKLQKNMEKTFHRSLAEPC